MAPSARKKSGGGTVSSFEFNATDIVIVGDGVCGRVATSAARAAGATMIFMRRRTPLRALVRWFRGRRETEYFDQGSLRANYALFSALYDRGHAKSGDRPRLFLAGDFVEGTTVLASAFWRGDRSTSGVPPSQVNGSALEAQSRGQSLLPTSLHAVWKGDDAAPAPLTLGSFEPAIRDAIVSLDRACRRGSRAEPRPDEDPVVERHPSALASVFIPESETVVIAPNDREEFDTAYFDVMLAHEYVREGVKRIILLPDIIVLQRAEVERVCRRGRLDLTYTRLS